MNISLNSSLIVIKKNLIYIMFYERIYSYNFIRNFTTVSGGENRQQLPFFSMANITYKEKRFPKAQVASTGLEISYLLGLPVVFF